MQTNRSNDLIAALDQRKKLRLNAALKLLVGGVGAVVGSVIFHILRPDLAGAIVVIALPGAFALVGLLELISGTPLSHLSQRWDSLQGWQRGVLGTSIFLLTFGIFVGVLIWLASPFHRVRSRSSEWHRMQRTAA